MDIPLVPISVGELYDKYSILEIKLSKITDNKKLSYIQKEYNMLENIVKKYKLRPKMYEMLKEANLILWRTEDKLREKEKYNTFDREFIELARSVYKNNDLRHKIKQTINMIFDSEITEIKSYSTYDPNL
mgnify:CR=1 FL=1|tara:strand:- start:736 stop:1125 length:390 start_codon:yes stop_codon:yes gene_type:complete